MGAIIMICKICLGLLFLSTSQNSPFFKDNLIENDLKERIQNTTIYLKKANQDFARCLKSIQLPDTGQVAENRCKESLWENLSWNNIVGLDDQQIECYVRTAQKNKADATALDELAATTANEIAARLILAIDYIKEAYERTHSQPQVAK